MNGRNVPLIVPRFRASNVYSQLYDRYIYYWKYGTYGRFLSQNDIPFWLRPLERGGFSLERAKPWLTPKQASDRPLESHDHVVTQCDTDELARRLFVLV